MKKFWLQNKDLTVEQWLAKAIHQNIDFSFSIKRIPSQEFINKFKLKYEQEFLRLETLDPHYEGDNLYNAKNHYNAFGVQNGSAHSSVYSLNLARSISVASQSEQGQVDSVTVIKNFDEKQIMQAVDNKFQDTRTSTGV